MKWILGLAVLGAAGWFGFRYTTGQRAEEAVIASVCAQELTDEVMTTFASTQRAIADNNPLVAAANAERLKQLYASSSLAPHLAALRRLGDPSIPHVKELAKVAAARCPDVFPEPIKAEKPIGYVWMMSIQLAP